MIGSDKPVYLHFEHAFETAKDYVKSKVLILFPWINLHSNKGALMEKRSILHVEQQSIRH